MWVADTVSADSWSVVVEAWMCYELEQSVFPIDDNWKRDVCETVDRTPQSQL